MSKDVFLSHASQDAEIAGNICDFLEESGLDCFIAPRDIKVGEEYAEELVNGIDNSKIMILILSKNSNSSPHVLREVDRAVGSSIPILVYRLGDVELSKSMEYFIRTQQWLDAKNIDEPYELLNTLFDMLTKNENKKGSIRKIVKDKMEIVKNISNEKLLLKLLAIAIGIIVVIIVGFIIKSAKKKEDKTFIIIKGEK